MKVMKERYRTPTADTMDTAMSLGITLTMVVMAKEFGFGKKRLLRLQKAAVEFLETEIRPHGDRYTQQYRDELEYALVRMQQALAERLE